MFRPTPRLSRIFLASALTFASSGSAVALAQPSPSPVPMPYPLANEPRAAEPSRNAAGVPVPFPCVPIIKCLPKAAGTLQLGASPGENTGSGSGKDIEVLAWGWGAMDTPPAGSADPQEGGEVVKHGAARASVSEMTPTKKSDKSSPVLLSDPAYREPGKLEVPNLGMAQAQAETPPPSGTVTLLVPAGTCVQGAHYSTVTLRSEGKAYELHDVTVVECGPASAAKGKKAQTQKLQYLKVEMKEILVSG